MRSSTTAAPRCTTAWSRSSRAWDAASYGNVSPEQNSNLWKDRIAYVQTSASYPCTVRVMQAYLYDAVAAAELGRKKAAGCDVKVVVHRQEDGDPNLGASAKAELCADRVPIKGIKRLHDKVVISSSVYGSLGYTQQVITGSTNMTTPALRYNDELMLQISGAPTIYSAYLAHFDEANDNATTVSCP